MINLLITCRWKEGDSHASGKPWSSVQPNLHVSTRQKERCVNLTNEALQELLADFNQGLQHTSDKKTYADLFSRRTAETIVRTVGSVIGLKRPTHRKGKFETVEITRAKAEVTTISKARDLIRRLYLGEVVSEQDKTDTELYLRVCLDRLCRMGLSSLPHSSDLLSLHEWSETVAPFDIKNIVDYVRSQKQDLRSKAKIESRNLFMDPTKRGELLGSNYRVS